MPAPDPKSIRILTNAGAIAAEGARRFVEHARDAIAHRQRFAVVLAGGGTPKAMQLLLAQSPLRTQVDWTRTHVFWGDERFVPTDHPDSTCRVARETLLNQVPIPQENIHAPVTTGIQPEEAAAQYAKAITEFFGTEPPRFDLVFLGLGPDGHTASLFPNAPTVTAPTAELVCTVLQSPKPPPIRLTFSLHLLNLSAHVIFMADGESKAEAVQHVFDPSVPVSHTPAKGVRPNPGTLTWLLDSAAAARLTKL